MTKLKSILKKERKQSKRQKNEKLYISQNDDFEECGNYGHISKSRIPSKQQYRRLKRKCIIHDLKVKKPSTNGYPQKQGSLESIENKADAKVRIPRLSIFSDNQSESPSHSNLSFHIQPDWAEFEDIEHYQFESELDVDLSKVFKHFDEKQIMDFGVFDDVCQALDVTNDTLSNWAMDLSSHRYDHALSTVSFVEEVIKSNYPSIFDPTFKRKMWLNCLEDANSLLIFCESNKYLFKDLMTKEYSISMQNGCLKWTELGTKCSTLKTCLEKIMSFHDSKMNLDTTLNVLYDQCLTIIDHGLVYPDPLVFTIIEGVKKIWSSLTSQFHGIQTVLGDFVEISERCYLTILKKLDRDIEILEQGENSEKQLYSVVQTMGIYLGKDTNWIQEPVLNFCF